MRPILFIVHNGDLDELVRLSTDFDDEQSSKFYEAVNELPDYLRRTLLEDERALEIGLNMVRGDASSEIALANAHYLCQTGITTENLIGVAKGLFEEYGSQSDDLSICNGFAYLSVLRTPGQPASEVELREVKDISLAMVEKAIEVNDFDTAVTGLRTLDNFGLRFPQYFDENLDRLHESLHLRFYEEAVEILGNEYLACYRDLIPSVTEKLENAQKKTGESRSELRNLIEDKYRAEYGDRVDDDERIRTPMLNEMAESFNQNVHPDGIYCDVRDEDIREKDSQYQDFVNRAVRNLQDRDRDDYSIYGFPATLVKRDVTDFLHQARQILFN